MGPATQNTFRVGRAAALCTFPVIGTYLAALARHLNWWGRRIRKGPPWPDCPTRYGNRAPTPRSKRKREARFLIKSQEKAQLAAHLVLVLCAKVLSQQGCAHTIFRHLSIACKQSNARPSRTSLSLALQLAETALWLRSAIAQSTRYFRAVELDQSQG